MGAELPLVVVVGPTAAGKSELAVRLAFELDGEVLSADSMQVYRGFDIGTAKPTAGERRGVPHHLIDVVDPGQPFSAARFAELADEAISEIRSRGREVIVAGGTGLYVRALLRGLCRTPAADEALRAEQRRRVAREGVEALHAELAAVDPAAARRIDPRDFVRISRALEVFQQTGRPLSELQQSHRFAELRHPALLVGLDPPREVLRPRIDRRVEAMLARGWIDEVRALVTAGARESAPMRALGYRQLLRHLEGELDLDEAVRQTKRDTWRFARRQMTWFRAEPGIRWYRDGAEVAGETVRDLAARFARAG